MKETNITLVCGLAGSGKTTHMLDVQGQYNEAIFHDLWVEEQYKVPQVNVAIASLFPCSEYERQQGYKQLNKAKVLEYLQHYPNLNTVLANYFKSKFSIYISTLFRNDRGNIIIECPFLDDNIRALKSTYKDQFHIIRVETDIKEIMKRLRARGWDEKRIGLSLGYQLRECRQYKDLIDEVI